MAAKTTSCHHHFKVNPADQDHQTLVGTDLDRIDRDESYISVNIPDGNNMLLQLETTPTGRSDRRLSPKLESNKGLCQPPHGKGFGEGARSGSRPDLGGTSMAVTTLISKTTGTAECDTSENRSLRGGNSASGTVCTDEAFPFSGLS